MVGLMGVVRGKTRVLADDWDVWVWLESITDGVLATSRRRSIFSFQAAFGVTWGMVFRLPIAHGYIARERGR